MIIRAHGLLYAPAPVRFRRSLGALVVALPVAIRRSARSLCLAAALLAGSGLWGYLEVRNHPSSGLLLLSGAMQENAESFQDGPAPREGDPLYGAFYFTNNAQVAIAAFALGASFGLGTALILLFNGATLGATLALVEEHGSLHALLSYVLPHSGLELFATCLAAAAGFQLGLALLRPGWRRRRDALTQAARESLPLILGAAGLLAIAGLTEGWISPKPWPLGTKAAIGGLLDLGLVLYLSLPGAQKSSEGEATQSTGASWISSGSSSTIE